MMNKTQLILGTNGPKCFLLFLAQLEEEIFNLLSFSFISAFLGKKSCILAIFTSLLFAQASQPFGLHGQEWPHVLLHVQSDRPRCGQLAQTFCFSQRSKMRFVKISHSFFAKPTLLLNPCISANDHIYFLHSLLTVHLLSRTSANAHAKFQLVLQPVQEFATFANFTVRSWPPWSPDFCCILNALHVLNSLLNANVSA